MHTSYNRSQRANYSTARVKRHYKPSHPSIKQRIQNRNKHTKPLKSDALNKGKQIRNSNNWSHNKNNGFTKPQWKQNQLYLTKCGISVKLNNKFNHKSKVHQNNDNNNNFINKMHNNMINNNHTTYNKNNHFHTKSNKRYNKINNTRNRNKFIQNNKQKHNRNGFNNKTKTIRKTIQNKPKNSRRTNIQFSIDNDTDMKKDNIIMKYTPNHNYQNGNDNGNGNDDDNQMIAVMMTKSQIQSIFGEQNKNNNGLVQNNSGCNDNNNDVMNGEQQTNNENMNGQSVNSQNQQKLSLHQRFEANPYM